MTGTPVTNDDWTYVEPNHKNSQRSKRITNKRCLKEKEKLLKGENNHNSLYGLADSEESVIDNSLPTCRIEQERIKENKKIEIQCCMELLEHTKLERSFDMDSFIYALEVACSVGNRKENATTYNESHSIIKEIICYGIGNFLSANFSNNITPSRSNPTNRRIRNRGRTNKMCSKLGSTDSYSPSMIQLACVLLLRKFLAQKKEQEQRNERELCPNSDNNNNDDQIHSQTLSEKKTESVNLSFLHQQKLIPMLYFEPCINKLEKLVLSECFFVTVLECNERGERKVDGQSAETDGLMTKKPIQSTLFYMPHCPMRLYSNVIWANWEHLTDGRIIIFGNSFHAYDQRIIDGKKRNDPTNGIFRLIPFVREICVQGVEKNEYFKQPKALNNNGNVSLSNGSNFLTLNDLEVAFNDCVVTYFSMNNEDISKDDSINLYTYNYTEDHNNSCNSSDVGDRATTAVSWPGRPKRYNEKDDQYNNNELI